MPTAPLPALDSALPADLVGSRETEASGLTEQWC